MKKLLILSLLMLPFTVSASWYVGRQCGNGQDSGKQVCNPLYDDAEDRLCNLEKLNNFYKEEDNLQEEEQNFITEEKIFIDQIKKLDPFTPYEEFTQGMGSLRFASDELLNFKSDRLHKDLESSVMYSTSGKYQARALLLQKDFKNIDRIKQLKELHKSYKKLEQQVDEYDKWLKDYTIITIPIFTCDSYTQYRSQWKTRSQQNVIPKNNNQLTILIFNTIKDLCLKDKDQGIKGYKDHIVDATAVLLKEEQLKPIEPISNLSNLFLNFNPGRDILH